MISREHTLLSTDEVHGEEIEIVDAFVSFFEFGSEKAHLYKLK
jgi:hypothetical protein